MRWIDLFSLSLQNLWRRKLRTILTIVGVMIGTCSIVVMISLGLGANKSVMEQYAARGSLTMIQVQNQNYWDDRKSASIARLTDTTLSTIGKMEHVEAYTPVMELYGWTNLRSGKYTSYGGITGIDVNALSIFGYELADGEYLTSGARDLQLVMGDEAGYNFYDERSRNYDYQEADIDWLNAKFFYDINEYDESTYETKTKSIRAKMVGRLAPSMDYYSGVNYSVYCDIDYLKQLIKENRKAFSDTKTNEYRSAWVKVDKYENAVEVAEAIKEMGFGVYAAAEEIKSAQQQQRSMQLLLGGVGSIAMLVAAISIANTMLMSIYERTREIGVMKVLGCKLRNISVLFLGEAGLIGLFGGVFGVGLSYGLSAVLNYIFTYYNVGDYSGQMSSYIPLYLAAAALAFSILVGIVSGLYPSQRAMRLSALAAIRNDV